MEGDSKNSLISSRFSDFNPLPQHGGRLGGSPNRGVWSYISIHSLRMEGDFSDLAENVIVFISIHSLRMEGDIN